MNTKDTLIDICARYVDMLNRHGHGIDVVSIERIDGNSIHATFHEPNGTWTRKIETNALQYVYIQGMFEMKWDELTSPEMRYVMTGIR